MSNNKYSILINCLGGLSVGICLSLAIVGIVLLYPPARQALRVNFVPTVQLFEIPMQELVQTQTNPLDQAEESLNSGYPEDVRNLLYPMIENWTSNEDRIRGYKLLGEAELAQGHPQLAIPYFEKLYFYQPTPENLFLLAVTYDAGGDNRNALKHYQELAKWEDLPPEIDIELINVRIENISRALGTPVPTKTDLP